MATNAIKQFSRGLTSSTHYLRDLFCSLSWLKKHGLVARKLTILDALAPTMIPHSTKYVPILDKHVLSKVFDQVSFVGPPLFKVSLIDLVGKERETKR